MKQHKDALYFGVEITSDEIIIKGSEKSLKYIGEMMMFKAKHGYFANITITGHNNLPIVLKKVCCDRADDCNIKSPKIVLSYKGYVGVADYNNETKMYHGEVIGIKDVITFQATLKSDIDTEFKNSVDDYLDFCKERIEIPN